MDSIRDTGTAYKASSSPVRQICDNYGQEPGDMMPEVQSNIQEQDENGTSQKRWWYA